MGKMYKKVRSPISHHLLRNHLQWSRVILVSQSGDSAKQFSQPETRGIFLWVWSRKIAKYIGCDKQHCRKSSLIGCWIYHGTLWWESFTIAFLGWVLYCIILYFGYATVKVIKHFSVILWSNTVIGWIDSFCNFRPYSNYVCNLVHYKVTASVMNVVNCFVYETAHSILNTRHNSYFCLQISAVQEACLSLVSIYSKLQDYDT